MIMQGLPSTITLLTIRALIRFLSSMYSHVIFQGLLFFERFATSITNVLESAGEVLCRGVVYADFSAALAIAKRKDAGKLRLIT